MTTATPTPHPGRAVVVPLVVGVVLGLTLVALGALVSGSDGAVGAAIGATLVCVVFATGAVVLGAVAHIAPAASLLVALLTYTLQVVLVGAVYVALRDSGALGGPVDPRWLSGAVIAGTLAWTTTQIVVSVKARQPAYDLPSHDPEAGVR